MAAINLKSLSGLLRHLTLTLFCVFIANVMHSQEYIPRLATSHEPDSVVGEAWIETDSKWLADSKTTHVFDPVQNVKSIISYSRDLPSSQWRFTSRNEIHYGINGKDSLEIYSSWFSPASKWNEETKTWYKYDSHGNNTLITGQYFDTEILDWVDRDKYEIFYDKDGHDTLKINSTWSLQAGWTASYKTRSVYDENGRNVVSYLYSWDQTDVNKWLLYSKRENTFDLNGNMILSMPYSWDLLYNEWLPPQYKLDQGYDENGYLTSDSSGMWITGSQDEGQWVYTSKNVYINNDEGAITRLLIFSSDGFNPWVNNYRFNYYYPGEVTLVPGIPGYKISAYPNPSREYVTFNLPTGSVSATVEIWDPEGRKVLDQILPDNRMVNISSLAKGLYMIRINGDGIIYNCKIIKE